MGIKQFGLPTETVKWISESFDLNTFVEAGTYLGDSANLASSIFSHVITIERDINLFNKASKRFSGSHIVSCYHGCTRDHVIQHIDKESRVLFWLDAHWTYGVNEIQEDECPILDEISLIQDASLAESIILIDDARLFLAPPPSPHNRAEWPRIDQLIHAIEKDKSVYIYNDVIYIIPKATTESFSKYLQELATREFYNDSSCSNKTGKLRAFAKRLQNNWGSK